MRLLAPALLAFLMLGPSAVDARSHVPAQSTAAPAQPSSAGGGVGGFPGRARRVPASRAGNGPVVSPGV